MRILLFTDVHWGVFSSLIRAIGLKYSIRLEHLIAGLNWVNKLATEQKCDFMICAGDYFDKSTTNDMELTALRDIIWNNLKCYFLVGNHESSVNDLKLNLTKALESDNHIIVSDSDFSIVQGDTKISFIPYIVESNRKSIDSYINNNEGCKKHIVISHNDIAGIQYGNFTSVTGFSKAEIEANCDLYLNGHLHNSEWISDKILNLGSLSAHNFTNDSTNYRYGAWILDTDTMKVTFFENPHSFNFYKLVVRTIPDIDQLDSIKNNSVLSISCSKDLYENIITKLNSMPDKIIAQRVLINREPTEKVNADDIIELHGTDHIQRFIDFCHEKINNTKLLDEELTEICK